jgi:outer membrane protein OmpA-like peptidoglycan-associated protein
MEQAKAIISNTEVMVSGSVLDKQYSDKMEQDVSQVLPKTYKVAFAVDVVTPPTASDEKAAVSSSTVSKTVIACSSAIDLKKQTLLFGFDKADLTATHKAKLDVVAGHMKGCTDDKMVLAGFTDVTGSKLYNKWLSQQRAEAVKRGLMRNGVEKERLKAVGYGEQYPMKPNTNKANRAQNRRVEFHTGEEVSYAPSHVEAAPVAKVQPKKVAPKADKVVKTDDAEAHVGVVSPTEPKLVKHNMTVSKTTVIKVISGSEVVSETIAKPWWARKMVSETAVEVQ